MEEEMSANKIAITAAVTKAVTKSVTDNLKKSVIEFVKRQVAATTMTYRSELMTIKRRLTTLEADKPAEDHDSGWGKSDDDEDEKEFNWDEEPSQPPLKKPKTPELATTTAADIAASVNTRLPVSKSSKSQKSAIDEISMRLNEIFPGAKAHIKNLLNPHVQGGLLGFTDPGPRRIGDRIKGAATRILRWVKSNINNNREVQIASSQQTSLTKLLEDMYVKRKYDVVSFKQSAR